METSATASHDSSSTASTSFIATDSISATASPSYAYRYTFTLASLGNRAWLGGLARHSDFGSKPR